MEGLSVNQRLAGITADVWKVLRDTGQRSDELFSEKQRPLYEISWWAVKELLPDAFSIVDWERIINLATENKYADRLNELSTKEAMQFILWVFDSLTEINNMERRELTSVPDGKLLRAGIKRLDILGNFVTLDMLCKGDLTKIEEVKKLSYDIVFSKLLKEHIITDVRREAAKEDERERRRKNKKK